MCFESDCLNLVQVINDGYVCPEWRVRGLVEEARWLLDQNSSFSLCYVPRKCNLAADWIAKHAVKGLIWEPPLGPAPTPLISISFQDFLLSADDQVRAGIG